MVEKAEALFARMTSIGLTPTFVTFNSLIDVYVRCNQMDKAWDLFAKMRNMGLKPDNFTCSTLVKGIRPSLSYFNSSSKQHTTNHADSSEMHRGFDLL